MSSAPVPNIDAPELLEKIREHLGADPKSNYWRGIQSELIQLFRLGYKIVPPPTGPSSHFVQDEGQGEDYYWSRCSCEEYFTALTKQGITRAVAEHQYEEKTA